VDDSTRDRLSRLWDEHRRAPFADAVEFAYYERLRVMAELALNWRREQTNPA